MEKLLKDLTGRLKKTYGDRLVSVILYGSATTGDYSGNYSDLNIFCALREVTPRELGEAEPIFRWWRAKGNPSPLLMSEQEVRTSTDCFPIEFHDIQERNQILYGADIVSALEIDYSFYRAQVEYQLRAKLLRLRQKAAGVLQDKDLLVKLLAESVSTFCILMRHALRLYGANSGWRKREIVEQAREQFGLDAAPFLSLLDLREGKIKPRSLQAAPLFAEYLRQIQVVVDAVDRLEK